jgi:hypothetical protein
MSMAQSTRKILILGRPKSGKLSLVKALTSSLPSGLAHETTPHAGLTHSITLTTRYYSVEAGIWIDEIPDEAETWLKEYSSEEASPVLQSLAAIVLTVDPSIRNSGQCLQLLKKLNERGEEVEWDGSCIVVGKKQAENPVTDLSSLCEDLALEYVDLNDSGENDYGGKISFHVYTVIAEKLGVARVLEFLHTCDWTSTSADSESIGSLQDAELEFELNAFDDDKEDGSEKDVEYMERMMAMLINARGKDLDAHSNDRNGTGDEFR